MENIYRTVAEVSLSAIRHNGQLARSLFPQQKILSVLKADAYGHGISGVVSAFETFTDWYAVATVEEALLIREKSEKPILLFGPVPEGLIPAAAKAGLTFTVGSTCYAQTLSAVLSQKGLCADCHLKIDTGLNRSGIRWREGSNAMEEIQKIRSLPNLHFTGTYSQFACGEGTADWELAFTAQQFSRFQDACRAMQQAGLSLGIRHCCSTGGSLVHPDFRLDMVRLGMLPLGMSFSDESVRELGLIPALTWRSRIAQVETLKAGEAISYSCTFRAEHDMRIGIVTCGYADGYHRIYSNKTFILAGGRKVPVVGRIAMDYTMIDLTDAPDAGVGTEVILLGRDGENTVSAQEISELGQSVSGEVTCTISPRVPRIYID
ncbi:MAG: alanine racemase [Clostridia bacterium]|nr:alanine racemase [Clostridia bacterium]